MIIFVICWFYWISTWHRVGKMKSVAAKGPMAKGWWQYSHQYSDTLLFWIVYFVIIYTIRHRVVIYFIWCRQRCCSARDVVLPEMLFCQRCCSARDVVPSEMLFCHLVRCHRCSYSLFLNVVRFVPQQPGSQHWEPTKHGEKKEERERERWEVMRVIRIIETEKLVGQEIKRGF